MLAEGWERVLSPPTVSLAADRAESGGREAETARAPPSLAGPRQRRSVKNASGEPSCAFGSRLSWKSCLIRSLEFLGLNSFS